MRPRSCSTFPWPSCPHASGTPPADFPVDLELSASARACSCTGTATTRKSEERNKSAAFGTGTTPPTIDLAAIGRSRSGCSPKEPPKYPYPIDSAKAARGAALYAEYCAGCHGASGRDFTAPAGMQSRECVGTKEDETISTARRSARSPHRGHRHRPASPRFLHLHARGEPGRRSTLAIRLALHCHFRKTFGYANMPLDGIWLRAPYLHNGSVPTLRELLEPAAEASEVVLSRQRRLRPGERRLRRRAPRAGAARKFFTFDTARAGQRQRRPRGQALRHRASPERQGRAARVSEDLLRDSPWMRHNWTRRQRRGSVRNGSYAPCSRSSACSRGASVLGWYKFFREEPQPDWVTRNARDALQVRLDRRRARRRHSVLDLLRHAARIPGQAARAAAATRRSAWRGSRGRSCRSGSPRK